MTREPSNQQHPANPNHEIKSQRDKWLFLEQPKMPDIKFFFQIFKFKYYIY